MIHFLCQFRQLKYNRTCSFKTDPDRGKVRGKKGVEGWKPETGIRILRKANLQIQLLKKA